MYSRLSYYWKKKNRMNKVYRLTGSVPSKKNSRVNTRSGRSFPSKEYRNWHEAASLEIQSQGIEHFDKLRSMDIICFFKNNIRQDLDNRLSSILDLLKDLDVIKDATYHTSSHK